MKVCPACQQSYADDGLNFCLNDGTLLVKKDASPEPPPTVFVNQPITAGKNFPQRNAPANWSAVSPANGQVKPKSRAWLWVLGIFGAVILLCGGGFIGLIAVGVGENDNTNNSKKNVFNTNIAEKPGRSGVLNDDLSKWKMPDTSLGTTSYLKNEFYMTSKPGNYYFVLLSGNDNFRTENAATSVFVRNVSGLATSSGFGLLVHNNIATALAQDYAFLIDSAKTSYRIVKHQARRETEIADWTTDGAINNGTQSNKLEVRDNNGKMGFYINGKLVASVEDKDGISSGVPGLYASGGVPIAFSSLRVEK